MKKALAGVVAALLSLTLASLAEAQTRTVKRARVTANYSDSLIVGAGLGFAAFEFGEAKMKSALTYELSYHKFFNSYIGLGLSAGYYEADSEEFFRILKDESYTVRSIHAGPKFLLRFPVKYRQTDMEPYLGAGLFYFSNKVSVTTGDFDESGGAVGGGLEAGFKVYKNNYLFGVNAVRYINRQKFGGVSSNLDRTDLKIILGVSF